MLKTSRRAIGLLVATCALALAPLTPTAAAPTPLSVFVGCAQHGIDYNQGSFSCSAYVSGGTGLYNYSWSARNASIDTTVGDSIFGYCEPYTSFLVKLTVTDSNGLRKSVDYGYLYCDSSES